MEFLRTTAACIPCASGRWLSNYRTATCYRIDCSALDKEVSRALPWFNVSDSAQDVYHLRNFETLIYDAANLLYLSASRRKILTRLNTRPARSPVNASTSPLRVTPHDLGPMWVATSHSCDSFIHYTSPV
jgi:hypothetical protein